MSSAGVAAAYNAMLASAQARLSARHDKKTRVTVQVGHCSQSVGAGDVADALASALPDSCVLTVAGCDGACFEAPVVTVADPPQAGHRRRYTRVVATDAPAIASATGGAAGVAPGTMAFFGGQTRVTLDGCGVLDATDVDEYIGHGGYAGLATALGMPPQGVVDQVKESGLRGRGGAYFPAALKWEGARGVHVTPRYLVVNSEEGEPGVFKDRHLMEGVPHRIIEGAIIAAYAAGVSEATIYINAEAHLSAERIAEALFQATDRGLVGDHILGSGFGLSVEIRRGAGGYVCGEETTLLNTMEGYRREPRLRPPFPTESGLCSKPTVINNAETLASVPFILSQGPAAFAATGTEVDRGTKLISLSGSVRRPGVAEVAMGATLRRIVFDVAGGPPDGSTVTAVGVGGPSSGVLPASELDTPIKSGLLHESGIMLGAGGVIALDDRMSAFEAVRNLAAYNAAESCGKCTPCREGTPRMVEVLDRLASGEGRPQDLHELEELARVVNAASLCGLGQAAGNPALSALHFFGDELAMLAGVR